MRLCAACKPLAKGSPQPARFARTASTRSVGTKARVLQAMISVKRPLALNPEMRAASAPTISIRHALFTRPVQAVKERMRCLKGAASKNDLGDLCGIGLRLARDAELLERRIDIAVVDMTDEPGRGRPGCPGEYFMHRGPEYFRARWQPDLAIAETHEASKCSPPAFDFSIAHHAFDILSDQIDPHRLTVLWSEKDPCHPDYFSADSGRFRHAEQIGAGA